MDFRLQTYEECHAVFRALHSLCPASLQELRDLPYSPPEGPIRWTQSRMEELRPFAATGGGALHVLTPLHEICLIGDAVRRGDGFQKRLRDAWDDVLCPEAVSQLSSDELEYLRLVTHRSPVAIFRSQNYALGVLFLLTQRLTEIRYGPRKAAALGPLPVRSLLDADAGLERVANQLKIDADVERDRVLAVFVPRGVRCWCLKYGLVTPELESVAALLRAAWIGYPDHSLPLHPEPSTTIRRIVAEVFRPVRYRNRKSAFTQLPLSRKLPRHADWLVRVQVIEQSPADIARRDGIQRQAVEDGIVRLAARMGLALRERRRSGRPPGRRELATRNVARK